MLLYKMIEILLIILQIGFIFLLISYCVPSLKFNNEYQNNLINTLSVKMLIFANILFIYSLTTLKSYFLLILLIVLCIYFFVKKKEHFSINFNFEFLYIIFLIFLISVSFISKLGFNWDAKFFWFMKVINFYHDEAVYNLNKLPATDYPHLGTYIWAFFWKFPFNLYEYHGRIFYVFFFVISIFSFFDIFKINQLNKLIFSTLSIIISFSFDIISGNQEIIIFSLSLLSAKFCYLIFTKSEKKNISINLIILLLIFNFATWIKNEGFFIIGFTLLIIFFLAELNKSQKKIIFFGSCLIIFLRIVFFKFLNTDLESFEFEKTFALNNFEDLFKDIKIILLYAFFYLSQLPLMALGLIVLLYNLYKYKLDRLLVFIVIYLLFNILFIFGAFIFSMENVEWQVKVGLKRVLFETSGFYLITIAYLVNKIQKKI